MPELNLTDNSQFLVGMPLFGVAKGEGQIPIRAYTKILGDRK